MASDSHPPAPEPPAARSRPHQVAALVLGLEAVAMLGVAAWQEGGALRTGADNQIAQGSAAYFLVFGLAVAAFAVAAWRGARWVFGPAVFLQVLALPMAVSMASEGFWVGAGLLGGLAVLALVALLAPSGRAAFGRG
jgi:peptidoglycan/LPS O-acetylase OafA/YrhL